MRILFVYSGNSNSSDTFIIEQLNALKEKEIEIHCYQIKGKGLFRYLKSITPLRNEIVLIRPEIIHAHYGLTGLLCHLAHRKTPIITTFHGSDIHISWVRILSYITMLLSNYNVFVSEYLVKILKPRKKFSVIPCGIDLDLFYPLDKNDSRDKLNLPLNSKLVIFSSSFNNKIKNSQLALRAINKLGNNYKLIELKGYTREEVNLLVNAADVALLTSIAEGSPQFIKEAMACNCPIVSTNVGDVNEMIKNIEGCYICSFEVDDVIEKIEKAFSFGKRTIARNSINRFNNELIADQLILIYKAILNRG